MIKQFKHWVYGYQYAELVRAKDPIAPCEECIFYETPCEGLSTNLLCSKLCGEADERSAVDEGTRYVWAEVDELYQDLLTIKKGGK